MTSLNASRFATFREMELPATLPYVLTGAEIGIVLAVIGAIVGEYLGGNSGLGYLAVATLNAFDVQAMFAVIFVLTLMGFVLYFAVVALRRRLRPGTRRRLRRRRAEVSRRPAAPAPTAGDVVNT